MAVPTPHTFALNDFASSAELNSHTDAINFLLSPPRCLAFRTAPKSTANNTDVLYDMDDETYDSDNIHDNTTNNSRLVVPEPGLYQAIAQVSWAPNATGRRAIQIRKNSGGLVSGGTQIALVNQDASSGGSTRFTATVETPMVATDYLELFLFQNSGGALNVENGSSITFFQIRWVSTT